jgi:hypothetical protein
VSPVKYEHSVQIGCGVHPHLCPVGTEAPFLEVNLPGREGMSGAQV